MKDITNTEMLRTITGQIDNYHTSFDELKSDIKEIKAQTIATNGRVTRIEYVQEKCPISDIANETEAIRFFVKYPKISKFIVYIVIGLLGINTAATIINSL